MKTFLAAALLVLLALPVLALPAAAEGAGDALPLDADLQASITAADATVKAGAGTDGVGAGGSPPPAVPRGAYFLECKDGRLTLYDIIGAVKATGWCSKTKDYLVKVYLE